jgi:pimeloyl-ACP methyl ester carboxylesterase
MMNKLLLLVFLICTQVMHAKVPFRTETFRKGSKKSWLYIPDNGQTEFKRLIVFLHGFGAKNAAVYGAWINELLGDGYVVLFPKFHTVTAIPRVSKYEKRVQLAIEDAQGYLKQSNITLEKQGLVFIGHSIGGLLSANLAAEYGQTGAQQVDGIFCAQPGVAYVNWKRGNDYRPIDSTCAIVCVTGHNDFVVKFWSTRLTMNRSKQVPDNRKVWIDQKKWSAKGKRIKASHAAPVAIDMRFGNGTFSYVNLLALMVGRTNEVDEHGYWRLTRFLLELADNPEKTIDKSDPQLIYMGEWNGQPIESLKVVK